MIKGRNAQYVSVTNHVFREYKAEIALGILSVT